ncbi:Hypothetical protein D9617_26g079120 [Elsinoe fawcettii]|nr:Hypothetical protein D9617_26g079120 [Elsinoe fawcettii]
MNEAIFIDRAQKPLFKLDLIDRRKERYKGLGRGNSPLQHGRGMSVQKERSASERHPEIFKHIKARRYDKAWEVYKTLSKEELDDSVELQALTLNRRNSVSELLRELAHARRTAINNDDTDYDNAAVPSLTQMWTDLKKIEHNADDRATINAAVAAMKHIQLVLSGKDVFGTPYRRRNMQELLDFWYSWMNKNKDRPAPAVTCGILPQGAQLDTKNGYRNPMAILSDYVDLVHADFHDSAIFDIAICIHYVLEDGLTNSSFAAEFEKYRPFIDDMNKIWVVGRWTATLDTVLTSRIARHVSEENTRKFLAWVRSKMGKDDSMLETTFEDDGSVRYLAEAVSRSVGRFLERQNLRLMERAWQETEKRLAVFTPQQKQDPDVGRIYDQFLFGFRSLRRASWTVAVWNHMIRNGVRPTRKTWNVMLKGCHIGREVDQMEEIWQRMIRSGCRPDAISWATRIHGLFKFDRVPQAFAALAELSHSANKPPKPSTSSPAPVLPDLSILNNALSGAQHLGPEVTGRILAWGRGHAIEPDITTYNTLINAALHSGQRSQARKIMSRMSERGIPPDGATFVILLHALFQDGFLSDLSPSAQETAAMDFISSLERDGIKMEQRGYALLLDRLLKEHNNTSAATAVLTHMMKAEISPTPHMYTIMMTHYFSQSPPNIPAIEALWRRLQSARNYVVDVILYDRMVEGFARADEYGKMMYFLIRMGREGKRPGWVALTEALRCIVRKGDRQRAGELVRDVARGEGAVRTGVRGRKGYDEFWGLVEELGLMPVGMGQ